MGNRADTRPSTQVNPKTSAANLGKDDIDWIVTRLHYKLFGETVSRLLENYNWEASLLQNQWNSSNKSHATDLRPQGPAFNSHAREGVDQELTKVEPKVRNQSPLARRRSPRPHGRGYWISALRAFVVREPVLTLTAPSPSLSMTTHQTRMKSMMAH